MKRKAGIGLLGLLVLVTSGLAWAAPEAFEIGPQNKDQLPGGKEADGIIGDFILRNNRIEAVISCNAPLRKANMGTLWNAVTPGCLYDLTFRGENNDQLTLFAPSNQQGPVSYVRVVKDGKDGEAVVETVVTAAMNEGLFKCHEYRLGEDWAGLIVTTTLRNESGTAIKIGTQDRIDRLSDVKTIQGITVADAVDPRDKVGYAFGWLQKDVAAPPADLELGPGQEIRYERFIAIGHSPAQAFGVVVFSQGAGMVTGTLKDDQGQPIPSGKVIIPMGEQTLTAYPDDEGNLSFNLPPGEYELTAEDLGRSPVKSTLKVEAGQSSSFTLTMGPASAFAFDIRGEDGRALPCKVQILGINGTPNPNLGPANRAHGCLEQYHSETGRFVVQTPPGQYKVIVTRGIEYDHLEGTVTLGAGEMCPIRGILRRVVDTSGWISADFHNHSTPSGDNTCGTEDRIINLAAEHIEFAPTTEHNRLYDWQPYINKLGLAEEMTTIPGIELTGSGAHFNAFPFKPVPLTQDGGAPQWQKDPRLNAIVLRDFQGAMPERWVQLNHPDMVEDFIDRDGDGREDGGFLGLQDLIDASETWGPNTQDGNILTRAPFRITKGSKGEEQLRYHRQFIWLQMLNQGHRYWSVAVSDAHSVHGNGVGGWRIFVPSSKEKPAEIDWKEIVRNAKAGKILVTNGPFVEVETGDGTGPGGSVRAVGEIPLKVRVQCTDWIDIDRVQVLVNGRQRPDVNFTRASHPDWFTDGVVKFDRTISVPLSEDSHLIVVAYGENFTLATGYGTSWQSEMHPCAYTNPIFVDVDGGGFRPNGDTLEFPLPTKKISVEEAKNMLKRL
ncbi:MAG TPA: CehA/McbA family metallohydrolase [bacterium]|nr:carboxypeptidase regulatory-like domain-containing protein [Candidatus Omnitrophota bacterium]HOJ61671.1 CehA/McbA family metallohydrolase [bacterium]HPP01704.1 CehA/McbA family metallohydrolase [bacterium]